jgi:hypothetical protein
MTDIPPGPAGPLPLREPFPAIRLVYALGFAVIAWLTFWLIMILGLLQFIVIIINGQQNPELKVFALSLVDYLRELLEFISFGTDAQPFPIGPFPKR